MSCTVFKDVGEALRKLICENIAELLDENSVVFDSPGDIDASNKTKLSIFMYHVVENKHLRNAPASMVGDREMEKYPPLTLDLHYLFTPYAQQRETELLILAGIMKVFHENSVLSGELLDGQLLENANEEIRIVPMTLNLDEMNKLWSTFPNKALKPAASYVASPVRISSKETVKVAPAKVPDLDLSKNERVEDTLQ